MMRFSFGEDVFLEKTKLKLNLWKRIVNYYLATCKILFSLHIYKLQISKMSVIDMRIFHTTYLYYYYMIDNRLRCV